jgi:glycosyltransferase involved in cell wall biosynthesis
VAGAVGDEPGHDVVEALAVGVLEVGDDGAVEHHGGAVAAGLLEEGGEALEEVAADDVRRLAAGDRDGLAQALARYASEPELRSRHGRAARERVLERFSLKAMVCRYADFYDELLARGH